jgi:hypothetical protein
VIGSQPKLQQAQAGTTMRAAFRPGGKEGQAKPKAKWLERDWPSASSSIREGLEELFRLTPWTCLLP